MNSILLFVVLALFLIFSVYGAYHKGCRDTWKEADKIAQIEPLAPPQREPHPIELRSSPLQWPEMSPTTTCKEYQDEHEQAL